MKDSLQEASYFAKYTNLKPEQAIKAQRTTTATTLAAEKVDKTKRTWQEQVPTKYHHFGKICVEALRQLTGPCSWNHAIDLVEDAPEMLDCKTYPLPPGEMKLLDEFLEEHL